MFQTAAEAYFLARLYDRTNLHLRTRMRERIAQQKAPPNPFIPPTEADWKRSYTMQHWESNMGSMRKVRNNALSTSNVCLWMEGMNACSVSIVLYVKCWFKHNVGCKRWCSSLAGRFQGKQQSIWSVLYSSPCQCNFPCATQYTSRKWALTQCLGTW